MKIRLYSTLVYIGLCLINSACSMNHITVFEPGGGDPAPASKKISDTNQVLTTRQMKKWSHNTWPDAPAVLPATIRFLAPAGQQAEKDEGMREQQIQIQSFIEETFHQSRWWNWRQQDDAIFNPVHIELKFTADADLAVTPQSPGFFAKWFHFVPVMLNSSTDFELYVSAYQMQNSSIKSYHQHFQASLSEELWQAIKRDGSAACSERSSKATCLVAVVTQQVIQQLLLQFMPDTIPVHARQLKPKLWQINKPYGGANGIQMVQLCYASKRWVMGFENHYCAEIGSVHIGSEDSKTYQFSPENWHPGSFTEKDYALWPLDRKVIEQEGY